MTGGLTQGDVALMVANARGLASLGMAGGYDEVLYELADALDETEARAEAAERERDLIATALEEPCAECGHIDWRSEGYVDRFLAAEAALNELIALSRYGPTMNAEHVADIARAALSAREEAS